MFRLHGKIVKRRWGRSLTRGHYVDLSKAAFLTCEPKDTISLAACCLVFGEWPFWHMWAVQRTPKHFQVWVEAELGRLQHSFERIKLNTWQLGGQNTCGNRAS